MKTSILPNRPGPGDTVRHKGVAESQGTLREILNNRGWCEVFWKNIDAPRICHLNELEKVHG